MKIKHLKASGLKSGKTPIDHSLAPVTIFCGPNFSGKTARLDAIRLGLVGHLPELGKQSGSTMGLAANGRIGVELEFDTAKLGLRKTWTRSAKGKIVTTSDGYDVEIPPVLMDSNEYFSLGDKDRVRYVFGLATVEAPEETVNSIVAKTKMLRFDPSTPAHESVIAGLVDQIMASDRKRHDEEQAVQDWIEGLITAYRDAVRVARQNADRMVKTVQGITQIKAVEDDGVLRDCEEKIAAEEAEIARLTELRTTLLAESAKLRSDRDAKARIERRLAALPDYALQAATLRDQIEHVERVIKAEESKAEPEPVISPRRAEIEGNIKGLLIEIKLFEDRPSDAPLPAVRPGRLTDYIKEEEIQALVELDRCKVLAERKVQSLNDVRGEKERHEHLKECPFCGHAGSAWKVEIEARDNDALDKALRLSSAAYADVKTATAKVEAIKARWKEDADKDEAHAFQVRCQAKFAQDRVNDIAVRRKQIDALRGELDDLVSQDGNAQSNALRTHRQHLAGCRMEVSEFRQKLAEIEERAKATAADRTRLSDLTGPDYDRLIADKESSATGVDTDRQGAIDRKTALQERQRAFAADQQDARRQAQARLAADEATARVEVLAGLVSLLEALQVAMVEQAFRPLIETANRVTEGILPSALAFHDGELGRWAGSTWVSHQTFSGTEKALAYAGLSVALAKDSPIKIVLLDEMGRMEVSNCERVVERLLLMIEGGYIDQAVLVDVDAGRYRPIEALNKSVSIIEI